MLHSLQYAACASRRARKGNVLVQMCTCLSHSAHHKEPATASSRITIPQLTLHLLQVGLHASWEETCEQSVRRGFTACKECRECEITARKGSHALL